MQFHLVYLGLQPSRKKLGHLCFLPSLVLSSCIALWDPRFPKPYYKTFILFIFSPSSQFDRYYIVSRC